MLANIQMLAFCIDVYIFYPKAMPILEIIQNSHRLPFFLSSPSILLQESQTLPIFKELQYLQANQFSVKCHHHQFYVAFSTLM